jgi:hypothetical protein
VPLAGRQAGDGFASRMHPRGGSRILTEQGETRTVSPFTDHRRHRDVVWLEPRVVVEVTFSEMVGGWLRDPVLRLYNHRRAGPD